MSRYRMLSFIASALLVFAGAASAEQRYFEFTGTVTASRDAGFAPVGSVVRGSFNYDDASVGDYFESRAFYDVDIELVMDVNGRRVVSSGSTVTLHDYPDSAADLVRLNSTYGIGIDEEVYPDGYFGIALYGSGLDSLALPSSFDLERFNLAEGGLFLNLTDGVLLDFSVDSIVAVPAPCLKKNGKPDRHCKGKDR